MSNLYKEISSVLDELLMEKEYRIEPSPKGTSPLFLLLTLKTDKVGFATLNDEPNKSYSQAFEKIRELYSIHSSEWADFDLTLVLCKTNMKKIPDEFCNEIEVDPYFCRKFVIDISKKLKAELGSLPFIPLCPESIVGLKRPISAQTFLMQHGVNSQLAKYLVVPYARGIEKIIEECLEGALGKHAWLRREIEEFLIAQDEGRPKVRLKELEIGNFRAYRERRKLDLNADLVILFGPNGFGKTSFFDAIDFACTGGVARFDERFWKKTDRLLNTLKHLDSSRDDSFVKTTTLIDDKEVTIERYMKNRAQAYISGVPKDRTKALMIFTGLLEKPPDTRIENLVRLFRSTHLFGQEFQSLTSGFRDHSRLPEDTVSRMLAFQDYVEGINKTKKVSQELKRQIKEKESEITFLSNSLKSKEIEMKQLSQSAKIFEKPETVLTIGKDIAERIIRETNIQIELPEEFNQKLIQEWRTLIAAKVSSFTQKLEIIAKLEAKFPELVNHRKRLKERSLELTQKRKLLSELNKDYSKKKKKIGEFDEKLKTMFLEERNLSLKKESCNWLLQAKDEYAKFKVQIAKEDKNHRNIQAKLLELLPKIEKLKSEHKEAEENINRIKPDIKAVESVLNEVNDLAKSLEDWQKTAMRRKELEVYLQMNIGQIDNIKNGLRIKKDELTVAIRNRDKLKENIHNLEQSQSELQTLLDRIEIHILNNICPVCGTLHKSREELIEKLKIQRGIQPKEIQGALRLFEDARGRTGELRKYISDSELQLKQLQEKAEDTKKELLDIEVRLRGYDKKAISLDIPLTPENLKNVIDSKKRKASEQMNIKQQELFEQKSKTKELQDEITTLVKKQRRFDQNLLTIESKQNQLRSMIDKISSDASTRQISLELEKEITQHDLTTTRSTIEALRKEIEIQQTEIQNLQKENRSLLEKRNLLEREIQELEKEISNSKGYIGEVESLINRLSLRSDIEMDQILVLREDFVKELSHLESLQTELRNFEISLDAAQISAALAKIKQDIENIKRQFQNIEKKRNQLNSWSSYFDVICKEIESMQNRSLKGYTEKYGPLASTIQRRLRSVYSFGELRLHPEKGEIAVRVERKGEINLHPSDYFSESQIQILMLSLFLSAALTQTWSSFAPILLDDPVEHFDDLNAYSLLDFIKGLIESDRERQIIISTCEDRLFRLMRQKFSKMDGGAIFYEFKSIGEKGPEIKRL